ncbi:hypothetical protein F8388_021999 [Cannabis sativa]|uniref:Enoyl reductase (ER) domain-containing protein n=1 Tax=Cannabis sativa TaxID=3483 RepID=A0A7J6G7W8_CANSA|nr:hypothetical protein F8388_021999 [Cannabis sativa]
MRFFTSRVIPDPTRNPSTARHHCRSIVTACRAVLLPRFGGPDVLQLRPNVEVPDLNPNQVLVRARAVSINPLDTRSLVSRSSSTSFMGFGRIFVGTEKGSFDASLINFMRSGYGRSLFGPLLPLILGRDISGEVAAVGASVKTLNVGQEVFGALHPTAVRGTYTDYAILSEDELTPKPVSVTHVEASAIPFAALTAWRALKSTARITEGQRILVVGGGGAVGFAAIQLAVASGCNVATTCGSQSVDRAMAAGAEQAVDYTAELTDPESVIKGKFDAVLDTIGVPETERIGVNFLKRGGYYMTLQGEAASLTDSYGLVIGLPLASSTLLKKQLRYQYTHGIVLSSFKMLRFLSPSVVETSSKFSEYSWTFMRADAEGLNEIRRLTEVGKLKIPVEKTFPITQVIEAHEAKDKKHIPGKVVLEFD